MLHFICWSISCCHFFLERPPHRLIHYFIYFFKKADILRWALGSLRDRLNTTVDFRSGTGPSGIVIWCNFLLKKARSAGYTHLCSKWHKQPRDFEKSKHKRDLIWSQLYSIWLSRCKFMIPYRKLASSSWLSDPCWTIRGSERGHIESSNGMTLKVPF